MQPIKSISSIAYLNILGVAFTVLTAAEVTISGDGSALNMNGQTTVPLGLFGVHAVHPSKALQDELGITTYRTINFAPSGNTRLRNRDGQLNEDLLELDVFIDCEGDRYYEPLVIREPTTWREKVKNLGTKYGKQWHEITAATGKKGIVQWWNEPYLNWAERSAGDGRGSTIQAKWYDHSRAVNGGPVHLPGVKEPLRYMVWRDTWPTRTVTKINSKTKKETTSTIIGWSVPIPKGLKIGDTFEAAETRYWRSNGGEVKTWTVTKTMQPWDPTMSFFWSGRQNRDFYMDMFDIWSKALRKANKDVTILGGWDFNYSAGNWACYLELYRPLLQKFPDHIDGLTEHHYGINPAMIQAWYELGTGEGMAFTGRWLKNWNTECQGRLDPAVYGNTSNAVGKSEDPSEFAFWEAQYNLADIIGQAARVPAKTGSRTIHNFAGKSFADCGAAWALRLLKPLRGDLLAMQTNDQRIWTVAARSESGATLALYNSSKEDHTITLPQWGTGTVTRLIRQGNSLAIESTPAAETLTLASRHAVVMLYDTAPTSKTTRNRQQFFPREGGLRTYLAHKAHKKPKGAKERPYIPLRFTIQAELPEQPQTATLRLVTDTLPSGAICRIGNTTIELTRQDKVTDITIPVEALSETMHLDFLGPEAYRIVMASVIIDHLE